MIGTSTAFRERRVLFAVLLLVLAANAVVLVSYRTFYDERLRALLSEQDSLEQARDRARTAADEAVASEKRLFQTQSALNAFFNETLGKREDRIVPLIEEIYRTTRAAGLRPDAIGYASSDEPGSDALAMTFVVAGPYANVKRLLSELERSPRFLVVEQLALGGGGPDDPDVVRISVSLKNYFRPESLRPIREVREPGRTTRPRGAAAQPPGAARRAGAAPRTGDAP